MDDTHGAIVLQNVAVEHGRELTEEEQWQLEHAKLHEKHKGHDAMHMEMMLILIMTLVVGQVFLVQWKRRHFKSYQMCTLIGMWIVPVYVCLVRSWYRFLITLAVYTVMSFLVWRKSSSSSISGDTPRFVYKWFLFLHKMSYVLGIAGYIAMMFSLMGLNLIFGIKQTTSMDFGILLLFYGLYYGVLGRDFAHICTDRMACKIGYYTAEGLPKKHLDENVCAVCDNQLEGKAKKVVSANDEDSGDEKTYKLTCGHTFHEFCIRGWVVVGKLQTCPYCKEKVDLQKMFKNPWEKPHLFYGKLLDWIRFDSEEVMTDLLKKKYGLITQSAAIFNDEDEVESKPTEVNPESASRIRVQKQAERLHERALAEDPSIFDYDTNYDEIQAVKNEKKEEQKKADKNRESKYALAIIKAHKRREIETHSREERQQQKERQKEGDMFADKEVFVTDAYRKQMEEVQKFRLEEASEAQFNEMTSVSKQKMWEIGMGRTLLNDIARSGDSSIAQKKKKERHARERLEHSPSPTREGKEEKEKPKKSIYSDEEEETPAESSAPQKNFEGELKPGLNVVTKKAATRAEKLRERNFTPTPPGSDEEDVAPDPSRRRRSSSSERKNVKEEPEGEEAEAAAAARTSRKFSNKAALRSKVVDKEERLRGLKEILKQRNSDADIEMYRQRYLERRDSGFVVPPL
ncbi:unnamed protein product [Caenorhabditis auriculariae]|uniref:RING-type domain-containing protein n=1 Tax=Caenorhabditis auriculariae TaxID=2777116 RepID=A0A8S1H4U9_9PELO|nr:unnamed protein product [Caenorhabditis auriculariae]